MCEKYMLILFRSVFTSSCSTARLNHGHVLKGARVSVCTLRRTGIL